jgi:hypothetical protein
VKEEKGAMVCQSVCLDPISAAEINSRSVIEEYFTTYEPELKQAHLARKLKHRQFWAAGVNTFWCMDQHDKWKYKFGLCLHVAVDPFSGYLLWLQVWWNNSNPIVICNYYLETVESLGCKLLSTQCSLYYMIAEHPTFCLMP